MIRSSSVKQLDKENNENANNMSSASEANENFSKDNKLQAIINNNIGFNNFINPQPQNQ